MKTLLITLLITVSVNINTIISDNVPTIGAFAIRDYTDSQCTITSDMTNVLFTGNSGCWNRGKYSVKSSSWDPIQNKLFVNSYENSACVGSPAVVSEALSCDMSCQHNKSNNGSFYSCRYIQIPSSGTFQISYFVDNGCKSPISSTSGKYTGNDLCWSISSSTSLIPLFWDASSSSLSTWQFGSSGSCLGTTMTSAGRNFKCDGSCLQSQMKSNEYFACQYVEVVYIKSSYIAGGIFALSLVIIIFYWYALYKRFEKNKLKTYREIKEIKDRELKDIKYNGICMTKNDGDDWIDSPKKVKNNNQSVTNSNNIIKIEELSSEDVSEDNKVAVAKISSSLNAPTGNNIGQNVIGTLEKKLIFLSSLLEKEQNPEKIK